jgi:hypothetical protein
MHSIRLPGSVSSNATLATCIIQLSFYTGIYRACDPANTRIPCIKCERLAILFAKLAGLWCWWYVVVTEFTTVTSALRSTVANSKGPTGISSKSQLL